MNNPNEQTKAEVKDDRHVYGASCSWNGNISQIVTSAGLPVCPHCRKPLYEMPVVKWESSVQQYAKKANDADYPAFVLWLSTRGTCSPLHHPEHMRTLRMQFDQLKKEGKL